MKKLITRICAVLAAACGLSAFGAPTPVAVWEDYRTEVTGFTLDRNGNQGNDDGSITITQASKGVDINFGTKTTANNGGTLLVRYESLATGDNGKMLFTDTVTDDKTYDRTGLRFMTDGKVCGCWNASTSSGTMTTYQSAGSAVPEKGVLAFKYAGGTYLFHAAATGGAFTQLYGNSTLMSGTDETRGYTIGGQRTATSWTAATGMKITGIAYFTESLTTTQLATYYFPSEITTYTCTISGEDYVWETELPTTLTTTDHVVFKGSGSYTLTRDITSWMEIQSGVTVIANVAQTGAITIDAGATLAVTQSGLNQTQLTNNGTIKVVGGTAEAPIQLNDNGAVNTGLGAITLDKNAYARIYATNGNKLYTVTGADDNSSTLYLSSGQNWGMTDGTQIRYAKVIVDGSSDFWLERTAAFDATVDLDITGRTLHVGAGYTTETFTIGSLAGSGSIVRPWYQKLSVNMTRAATTFSGSSVVNLAVNGTYPLTLTGKYTGPVAIADGASVKYDPGEGNELTTPSISTTGAGKVIVASGTVKLGTNRPNVDAATDAKVELTATDAELTNSRITIGTVGDDAANLADKITVYDAEPEEVTVKSSSISGSTLTLTLQTLPAITEATKISELGLASDAKGLLVIDGGATAEDAYDVTFDADLPSGVKVTVNGYVNLKVGGTVTDLPMSKITFESGSVITVSSDCTLTVPAGATANATGDITVKLTNSGTFNVVSGTCTVTTIQGLRGEINVYAGTTLKCGTYDAFSYNAGSYPTVNVWGTLDFGTYRQTLRQDCRFNFYTGCTVNGYGSTSDGSGWNTAMQLWNGEHSESIKFKLTDGATEGTVEFNSVIALQQSATVDVASGVTVNFNGATKDSGTRNTINGGTGTLTKSGDGTLVFKTGTTTAAPITVSAGNVAFEPAADTTAEIKGAITGGSNAIVIGGEGIVKAADALTGTVHISEGATLELAKSDNNYTFSIGDRNLSGTLLIDSGVTYTAQEGDVPNYVSGSAGGKGTVIVKGTLDMGGQRWSYNSGNKIVVYGGATVKGSNTSGAVDYFNDGGVIEAKGSGEVDWQATTRVRNDISIDVAEGVTINHSGAMYKEYYGKTITKKGEGTFNVTGTVDSHSFKLMAGTIKSNAAKTVTSGVVNYLVNTDTTSEEGVYIYTLVEREAGTIYLKNANGEYETADNAPATPIDGDVIEINNSHYGNVWSAYMVDSAAGHQVVLGSDMNLKGAIPSGVTDIVISNGVKVYRYCENSDGNIPANAVISGAGSLYVGYSSDTTIGDGVQITCGTFVVPSSQAAVLNGAVTVTSTTIECSGTLKLAEGASLTVPTALDEGKVTTSVAGKTVVSNEVEDKIVYSLVDTPNVYFVGAGYVKAFTNTDTTHPFYVVSHTADYYTETDTAVSFTVTMVENYATEAANLVLTASDGTEITKNGDTYTLAKGWTAPVTITASLKAGSTWPSIWTKDAPSTITGKFGDWVTKYTVDTTKLTANDEMAFLLNIKPTDTAIETLPTESITITAEGKVEIDMEHDLKNAYGVVYVRSGRDVKALTTITEIEKSKIADGGVITVDKPSETAGFYKVGIGYTLPTK